MALSAKPNITGPILEYITYILIHYHKLQHLIPYRMAKNIDVKLSLVIGKINHVSPNFILSTFNSCIKSLNAYILYQSKVFE